MAYSTAKPRRRPRPQPRAVDEIISALRRNIVTGALRRGDRLPTERELADQFGISQPTVREALRVLETLGLIDVQHGRGTFVTSDSRLMLTSAVTTLLQFENIGLLEILEMREILGRESAYVAAQRATPADIAALREAVEALGKVDDIENLEQLIARVMHYQQTLSHTSSTPLLSLGEKFLSSLLLRIQVHVSKPRPLKAWIERSQGHQSAREDIVARVSCHDPRGAHAAMERLLGEQRAVFEDDPLLRTLRLSDPRVVEVIAKLAEEFRGD